MYVYVYIYIYVCVCVCVCVYIYMYMYTHIYTTTNVNAALHTNGVQTNGCLNLNWLARERSQAEAIPPIRQTGLGSIAYASA